MEESSKLFVITLWDAGNPVDDLGKVHPIGVLPSSPFEVISNPGGEGNDNQSSPRQTESDSRVDEVPINDDGKRDRLLSAVLRIQQQEKIIVNDQNTSKIRHSVLPSSPFVVVSWTSGIENDNQDSPEQTESDSVPDETPTNHAGRDALLSPVLRIQQQEKVNLHDQNQIKSQLVLEQFFDISYLFCTSPMSTTADRKNTYSHSFRKICFGIIVTLSTFDSIVSMNHTYMKEGVKDFHRYTEMGFHVLNMLCKLYHVRVLLTLERTFESVTRLLLGLEECFLRVIPLIRRLPMELPRYKSLLVLFGLLPLLAAIIWGLFGFWTMKDWSWEVVLYFGAMDVGRTFIVWEQGMLMAGNNKTEELLFITTPDSVWISLGSLRMAGRIAAQMQSFAVCNVMIALAVTLFKHTKPLSRAFILLGNQLAFGVANSEAEYQESQFEDVWKYYFRLRKTSIELNRAFGGVIKCAHITNISNLLVILLNVVFRQLTVPTFINSAYQIVLMLIFYVMATKVNHTNELARKWIKDNTIPTSPIEVNTRTLHVLLDDIKQAPIGLGSGNFLIDGGFLPRVLGLVASLLAFMVEAGTDAVEPA